MGSYYSVSAVMALGLFGLSASFLACSGKVDNTEDKAAGCAYNGAHYAQGDSFPSSDGCNNCWCDERGSVACTLVWCGTDPPMTSFCSVDGQRYETGAQVSDDGCNTCVCSSSGEVACTGRACPGPGSCDSLVSEMKAALASVQSCTSAADCGQRIPDSSCGGTRDLIARNDADLAPYLAQRATVAERGCASEGGSTCDAPNADGFACIDHVCGWNYVNVEPEPDPACEPFEVAELCVRGTPITDGELIAAGDPLRVTMRSAGCHSSSCTNIVEASCAIFGRKVYEVETNFCVANTAKPGQACTADCGGKITADCSFGEPLVAGVREVRTADGRFSVALKVPFKAPIGGICSGVL